jgi:transcriptional regulator GlxA family with amidase domain
MPLQAPTDCSVHYSFLLVPGFSMIAFAAAVEPLRMANRLSGKTLYRWTTTSIDGEPVSASAGLSITPDIELSGIEACGGLFISSGVDIYDVDIKPFINPIKRLLNSKVPLGALCTGAYILARIGLLDGYRATIHWENLASLREEFPAIIVSSELFEIDRDRYVASGGTAPLDMMLNLISRKHGTDLAVSISDQFTCERIRGRHDRQRMPLQQRLGSRQPKLIDAVSLMEANLEEPMSLDELAGHVGVSRRQLERIFQKHLRCVPTRYYLELRLNRARQLLLQTSMSIVDVAFACGFVSAPHFSKCYRDCFGIPPRDERRLRNAPPGPQALT